MKPIEVTNYSYAEYNEKSNKRNHKFKVGDHVKISKYKKKDMFLIGQKKFLFIIKLKILYLGLMLLVIRMVNKLFEFFMKKNCKRLIKKNLE